MSRFGGGGGSDIMQRVVVALESQGADALSLLSEGIAELQGRMSAWTQKLADGAIGSADYIKAIRALEAEVKRLQGAYDEAGNDFAKYSELQKHLGEMEKKTQAETKEAVLDSAAARRQGTQAIADFIAKTREEIQAERDAAQTAGDAKRARIEAIAREEQAFEELTAELEKNRAAFEKEAVAEAWMTRQTTELAQALDGLAKSEREAATHSFFANPGGNAVPKTTEEMKALWGEILKVGHSTEIASGGIMGWTQRLNPFSEKSIQAGVATKRLNEQIDDTNRASKSAGYGLLIWAHAMQDAQYGTAAVLNNIPLMVQAIGGSAGLAGTVMIAAVAFEVAKPHLEEFGKKLGVLRDPIRDAAGDVAGLTEKLAAMEAKPFKVAADYSGLRELRKEVKEATNAIHEWEALKDSKTKDQTSAKQVIAEGITEGGGAKAVEAAILEIKKKQGNLYAASTMHGELANAKAAIGVDERGIKSFGGQDAALAQPFVLLREYHRSEVARIREAMENEAKEKIAKTVHDAPSNEGARKTLEDMYIQNRQVFEKHGVTSTFGAAIVAASPSNVAAAKENARSIKQQTEAAQAKKRKDAEVEAIVEEQQQEANRIGDEMDRGHKQKVGENVRRFMGGEEKSLTEAAERHFAMNEGADQIARGLAPQLAARAGIKDLPPKLRDDVVKQIIDNVMDKLGNKMQAAQEAGGGTDAQVAMSMLQDEAGKSARGYEAHLRTLAMMERMMGGNGAAAVELNQIEMRQRNLENMLGRQRRQPRFNHAKR